MFGLAPGIDGAEVLVILVVALIVVGPKDLPALIRRVGKFLGRMRAMASDFRHSFDEMARQSELDDLRREIAEMKGLGAQAVDKFTAPASEAMSDIQQSMSSSSLAASRPFAPAENVPQLDPPAEVGVSAASPPLAKASRPFALPSADEAATGDAPVAELPAPIPAASPSELASPRPFAPARTEPAVEAANESTDGGSSRAAQA